MNTMRKRLLVAYSCGSTFVPTTLEYLRSFKSYSDWDVHYVHATEQAQMDFDFASYDAIFHNYCARLCFEGYVSPSYIEAARRFRGVKVLAVQDEYDFTDTMRAAAAHIGFDIILTCVPENSWERVYPKALFPKTEFMRVLTGYVPADLRARGIMAKPLRDRQTLIGYRGRDIGARYGRLAFDKLEIGRRMHEICSARGLAVDIDWSEESRIYGDAWFAFLGACRATLATESGSNIFDLDGSIVKQFAAMRRRLGRDPSHAEFEPHIRSVESQIAMGQVSPRVFEAAALRTPLVMFDGDYSGVVTPDVHYIALRKDFSNVDDVLQRLEDLPALEAMAERAHADLVASDRYAYRSFVAQVTAVIERHVLSVPTRVRAALVPPETPDMLEQRLIQAVLLQEKPTSEPLSYNWYRIAAASRVIGAIREGGPKLLAWASHELARAPADERQRKLAGLAHLEQRQEATDQYWIAQLKVAHLNHNAALLDTAIAHCRVYYVAHQAEIVAIILEGQSPIRAGLAVLRAPWVAGDVPRLRAAKNLKERANKPLVRRAWTLARRLTSGSASPSR